MQRGPLLWSTLGVLTVWAVSPLKLGVVLGSSMAPSLRNHQVILIQQGYYRSHRPAVGDVVVIQRNSDTLVKRVSAVEGDAIWEVRDPSVGSFLVVSGADLLRIQRTVRRSPAVGTLRRMRIPRGYVYVMGDAAQCSLDSRAFGPVPMSTLSGRVLGAPSLPREWH